MRPLSPLLLLVLSACAKAAPIDDQPGPIEDAECTGGETRACVGSAGCPGGQACEEGQWGACDCGEVGGQGNVGGAGAGTGGSDPSGQCSEGESLCNGVCVNTKNDPIHCGTCGHACEEVENGSVECLGGTCVPSCTVGFGDCSAVEPGCETDLSSDEDNCAACGVPCTGTCGGSICRESEELFCLLGVNDFSVFNNKIYALVKDDPSSHIGVYDLSGAPLETFDIPYVADNFIVYGNDFYFGGDNGVSKMPMSPKGTASLVVNSSGWATHLSISEGKIYFVDTYSSIRVAALGGGPVTELATGTNIYNLVAYNSKIYWTEFQYGGGIYHLGVSGKAILAPYGNDYAAPGTGSLLVLGNELFLSFSNTTFRIAKVPLTGGALTIIDYPYSVNSPMIVSDSVLYFVMSNAYPDSLQGGNLRGLSANGQGALFLKEHGISGSIKALDADASHVFWLAANCVSRVEK